MLRPRLRRSVDVRLARDGTVVLLRGPGQGDLLLDGDGPALGALLERCDGSRDVDALARELPATREELTPVLAALAGEGVLDDDAVYTDALGPAQAARFDRQLDVFADQLGGAAGAARAQQRLGDASVCLLGLGGLGSWVAWGLVSAGVQHLTGVDGDVVEPSNLNRQILFTHEDVGQSKAHAADHRLRAFAPALDFAADQRFLASAQDALDATAGADVIVATVDQPAHVVEHWVQDAAFAHGVPLLTLSQHPPLVRAGPLVVPGVTGCLLCQEGGWRATHEDFALVEDATQVRGASSTFGPACGVAGALAAAEVVALLTGTHVPATLGAEQVLDLATYAVTRRPVPRTAGCPRCSRG